MNRSYFILIMTMLFSATTSFGQFLDDIIEKKSVGPETSGESLLLFADRMLYAVSEDICVSAVYNPPAEAAGLDWSSIIYFELVKWDGTSLSASKVEIIDGLAAGKVKIPSNLLSGNYYLKAYTRWMRNFSPYLYEYLPVKIVNPATSRLEAGPKENTILSKRQESSEISETDFRIEGVKERYGKRLPVSFKISTGDKEGIYLMKVAKVTESENLSYSFEDDSKPERISFIPEINGLTLSGKLVQKDTDIPVANTSIQLSTYPNSSVFSVIETNQNGEFFFALPNNFCSGEMHISEDNPLKAEHDILIADEFCSKPVTLPYLPFELDDREKSIVEEMIINAQIMERFAMKEENENCDIAPFYGSPATVTYVKDYIELQDLREFFYELIQHVSIREEKDSSYLVVHGQSSLDPFPPLILMDNIPVPNDDNLLGIPSKKIERIEVINHGYIVGNRKYSGLISIYSKDRDLAGIKLENSHFFNFEVPLVNSHTDVAMIGENMPDRRNLLYWNPGIRFDPSSSHDVEFYTSDATGEYELTVLRISDTGEIERSVLKFEVE